MNSCAITWSTHPSKLTIMWILKIFPVLVRKATNKQNGWSKGFTMLGSYIVNLDKISNLTISAEVATRFFSAIPMEDWLLHCTVFRWISPFINLDSNKTIRCFAFAIWTSDNLYDLCCSFQNYYYYSFDFLLASSKLLAFLLFATFPRSYHSRCSNWLTACSSNLAIAATTN